MPLDSSADNRAGNSMQRCSTDKDPRGGYVAWKVSSPHLSLSTVVFLDYVVSYVSEHKASPSSASARTMIDLPTSIFVVTH